MGSRPLWFLLPVALTALCLAAGPAAATEPVLANYMLGCQGCHLPDGRGYPERGVPRLTGYVGNFLKVPGGREFLVQVPGSAQSSLSNDDLALLLNWMLMNFSPAQTPPGFTPYTAAEVGRLRVHPVVAVAAKRAELVRAIDKIAP